MAKVTVYQKREFDIPDSDIEVLLEMASYGIAYWASMLDYSDGKVRITERDSHTDNPNREYSTTYGFLAETLVNIGIGTEGYPSAYADYAAAYLRDLADPLEREYAAGHIDSDLADAVVQYALFGELVYG